MAVQEEEPVDRLLQVGYYLRAMELWDATWEDCETLAKDFRGQEIAEQLTRSVGSISANIEEGYGRGFRKEYPHFLRIARGSARESKGWYLRARRLLPDAVVKQRIEVLDHIIGAIAKAVRTLEEKSAQGAPAGFVREPDFEW